MPADTTISEQINAFDQRDKFSSEVWATRHLTPSPEAICNRMSVLLHSCCNELLQELTYGSSNRKMTSVLKTGINRFKRRDYDTEEAEYICDLFYELATLLKIDFNRQLNIWLYGYFSTLLATCGRWLFPSKPVETVHQPCRNCSAMLETIIVKKKQDIPDISWFVGRCNQCGDLNLISPGSGIKEIRFGNYQWVDTIQKDEYTYEQALIRVEQIKFFRK